MFNKFSQTYIPKIDQSMEEFFKNKIYNAEYQFIKDLYSDLKEFCLRRGKRLRPLILLISYLGYNKRRKNLQDIIRIASVLEIMHSFLLIQDDIIDRSIVRRGKKAMHLVSLERYGELTTNTNIGKDVALILCDILFSNALEIISDVSIRPKIKNEFMRLFAKTYELTAWGQILDSINSMPIKIDVKSSDPMQISILKTAHYTILSPMLMGYRLSGGKGREVESGIKNLSIPLGLAFQIRDDILGVFGSREEMGKSSDSDIEEGKLTLLIQSTIDNLNKKDRNEFIRKFTLEKKTKGDIKSIKSMIEKSGALEISKGRLRELISDSREGLCKLKMKREEKKILSGLIDLIAEI